jgi:hypothetical protein
MKTVTHLTQSEIEDAVVAYVRRQFIGTDRERESFNAKIIVELEDVDTRDPREPSGCATRVRVIRAEVEES